MFNLLYEEYPFGKAEAFAKYEVQAFYEAMTDNLRILSFCKKSDLSMRDIPNDIPVKRVYEKKRLSLAIKACFKMLSKDARSEIVLVLKKRPPEGVLRCLYRIYRYLYVAELFLKMVGPVGAADVFSSYWLNECAYAAVMLKKSVPSLAVVSRGHGYDVYEERCYMPFRRQILSGLDRIYIINRAGYAYLEKTYPWLDMRKVQIAHLGVDVPQQVSHVSDRKQFHIVSCSSVIPLKRLDLLVDALALIPDAAIRWTHLGDGPLMGEIQERASEKLAPKGISVNFRGQITLGEVHAFYASTDVHLFVNCSDTEGTPVSIMEAMSYGIPCVARDVGGNAEVVGEDCGILVDADADARVLSKAIEAVMQMQDRSYMQLRNGAREKILCEFDSTKVYAEYAERILKAIG